MNNERARSFFDGDLDVSRILRNISLEIGVPITTDTLVLLDDYDGASRNTRRYVSLREFV